MNAVLSKNRHADLPYELVRNARVEVRRVIDVNLHQCAEITIDDRYIHRFPSSSRISKALDVASPEDIQARMTGGQFFIVNDKMVDFQGGDYVGFVHDDKGIHALASTLGFMTVDDLAPHRRRDMTRRIQKSSGDVSDVFLRNVWSETGIEVPNMGAGGDFTTQIAVEWSPFMRHVQMNFDLIRQICTNGMVGMATFLNTKVPIVNMWEQHLDIATTSLRAKVESRVKHRIGVMADERVSLATCILMQKHVSERMQLAANRTGDDTADMSRLHNMLAAVDPVAHLSDYYQEGVFNDKNIAARVPGHLSALDVFNLATELATHTNAGGDSTNAGLSKMANGLLFNPNHIDARITGLSGGDVKLAGFSDPDRAFFGLLTQ